MRVYIVAYLDGKTVGVGYRYIVTKSGDHGCGWRAYRTTSGLRRFLKAFGLKIDPTRTKYYDFTERGHGRSVHMETYEKEVVDTFDGGFWSYDEIPPEAIPFVDMCNGQYVKCFIHDEGHKVTCYKPNPNAKYVYGLFGMTVNLDEIS